MSKDERGMRKFTGDDIDPEVAAVMRDAGRRTGRKHARPAIEQQEPGAKDKKAAKDAQRNRRMIDPPPDLERELETLAAELKVSVSSLICWLVDRALQNTTVEVISQAREPSRSMRFEYVLRTPPPRRPARGGRR